MGIVERNQKIADIKKNEIISGMEKVLLSKSYDCLTIDDVAKEAEFSKKTIYSYFSSKDEIYLELLMRKFNLLNQELRKSVNKKGINGAGKLKALSNAYYEFSKKYPEYMLAMINFDTNKDTAKNVNDALLERFNVETEKSFLLLESVLKEAKVNGELSDDCDIVSTAILLWSNMNGFIMLSYKKGDYIEKKYCKSLDELFSLNFNMLERSLLKNEN